jgi:glycosyltransferase involved in cell wall biosynthesis
MPQLNAAFEESCLQTEAPPVFRSLQKSQRTTAQVLVNGRFRVHKTTGIGRYADEIISRLNGNLSVLEPKQAWKGVKGHLWEQVVLPAQSRGRLIWSPCSTGPAWLPRQVVTVHDLFPVDHPEWFSKSFATGFKAIVVPLLRRARRVIAVSEYTKSCAVRLANVPEEKVVVIHSGVGSQFSPQSAEAIAAARQAAGITTGRYLLGVSSLEARKNVTRTLAAWRQALPELPKDLSLVLVGGKGSSTVFQTPETSDLPPRVLLPGYVADQFLPGLYAGAQALVFPSLAEGFGFPLLEAMASGTPAMVSRNSSLVEVAGDAAYFIDPLSTTSIAKGMLSLATDEYMRRRLSSLGLSRASRFGWDQAASRTWDVLQAEVEASA